MHTDIAAKNISRRLRAAVEASDEAPYDWAEFQRRRQQSIVTRVIERNRTAAIAASVVAAVVVVAYPFGRLIPRHEPAHVQARTTARTDLSEAQDQVRTRALEGWLAGLPRERVIVRVGTRAAVSSLQDQIAALDDLTSAERLAGARPARLDALDRQRAQLVTSLAQLQYAEMLASANP